MNLEQFPLRAIVGPARSGTTWVGALVDSSPQVIYRFEPFHRLAATNTEIDEWRRKLKRNAVREGDIRALYASLCPAHPFTNKAPFFDRKSYPLRTFGRRQLWPLARLFAPLRALYQLAYSPAAGPPIVFKETSFVLPLINLAERTSIPIVYLVRHPCATVYSTVNSPDVNISAIHLRLRAALETNAPQLLDRYESIVTGTDIVSRHALMWLYQVESCVSVLRRSVTGMVITYEQLARETYYHTTALFRHFGIEFGESTRDFINELYAIDPSHTRNLRRTGWAHRYFTIYRNPGEASNLWHSRMSRDDRQKVESIVQGNPATEYCAAMGGWW